MMRRAAIALCLAALTLFGARTEDVSSSLSSGSSTPSSVAAAGAPTGYINVTAAAYGAKGDTIAFADGTITSGTNAFSSASATFTSADVGKTIVVDYAGAAGVPLVTTISGFSSTHAVTLGANASVSVPYNLVWAFLTTAAGTGYAPGDTVTCAGGTFTTACIGTVIYTTAVSATINAAGTGGVINTGTSTGACQVQGTTGAGAAKFTVNVTLTAGAVTSVGSFVQAGAYSTNPTSLSAEPVTPVNGCTGLSGATLNLTTGILILQPSTTGVYSVTSALSQGATSGAGTGWAGTGQFIQAGAFMYGTDDTAAWTTAINAVVAAKFSPGGPPCIFAPEGAYLISSSLPLFNAVPGCIIGSGRKKSWLMVSPALNGDLLSWSEAWADSRFSSASGGLGSYSGQSTGPILRDITILADRNTVNTQNAAVFYDRVDQVDMSFVDMWGFNGYCMASGITKNTSAAYLRESNFFAVRQFYCGNSTHPSTLFDSAGTGDATNEIRISQFDIFANFGHGFQIRSNGTAVRDITIDKLRIEGIQFDPVTIAADQFVIGDSSATGTVNSINCKQCEILSVYPGRASIRLDANGGGNAPYYFSYDGSIGGGAPLGKGLVINFGRDSEFYFRGMNTIDTNVTLGAGAGTALSLNAPGGAQVNYSYSLSGGSLVSYPVITGYAGSSASMSTYLANNTPLGGNVPGAGSINLGIVRGNPYSVASGSQSVVIGGNNNNSAGANSTVINGNNNILNGVFSASAGGTRITDRAWYGARCHASGSLTDFSGDANFCDVVLRCQAAATNASTCRATADNLTAGAANIVNIPNNAAYSLDIKCSAIDRATPGNNFSWKMSDGLLTRGANAASTTLVAGTTVTHSNGSVTGLGIAITADTTNGGLNITFTSPSTNSDLYDASCHVQTQQTQ